MSLLALGVFAVAWFWRTAEVNGQSPSDLLQSLVREWIDLQVEISEEDARWQEEKEHLRTTESLLEREAQTLDQEIASLEEALASTRAQSETLEQDIARTSRQLEQIDGDSREQGQRILAVLDSLPGSLARSLEGPADSVRESLQDSGAKRETLQTLRKVTALATDLDRLLSSVHATTEIIDIEGAGRMEVDVLYLGGAMGYYRSLDGRHAGILLPGRDGPKLFPRGEAVAEQVRRARAVFLKEEPAALVDLPVLPEGES